MGVGRHSLQVQVQPKAIQVYHLLQTLQARGLNATAQAEGALHREKA